MLSRARTIFMVVALVAIGAAILPTAAWGQTGVLYVESNKVGVGVATPEKTLHVFGTDGNTQLLVQEQSTTETARTMLNVQNNGIPYLRLTDTSPDGSSWTFQAEGPSFRFNKGGTGGAEIIVRSRNDASGNATLTVDGSVSADNVTFTSSRLAKTGFAAVDSRSVLDKVVALPIAEWTFKDELNGKRHIGPMAEEFAEAFDLGGTGTNISLIDASGVTLAAIQGLDAKLTATDSALKHTDETLVAENARMATRLAEVERQNAELASRLAQLELLLVSQDR